MLTLTRLVVSKADLDSARRDLQTQKISFDKKAVYEKSTLGARDRTCAILFDFITLLQSRGYIAQVQSRVPQSRFLYTAFYQKILSAFVDHDELS